MASKRYRRDPCVSRSGKPKKRWATQKAAEFVADYNTTVRGKPQEWYECPKCEGWHTATIREQAVAG